MWCNDVAQVKIFGLRRSLQHSRAVISQAIHTSVVEALEYPSEKKFHRFILLDDEDFIFPPDRSERYIIIEMSMFEGRSVEAKKMLIRLLYEYLSSPVSLLRISRSPSSRHHVIVGVSEECRVMKLG